MTDTGISPTHPGVAREVLRQQCAAMAQFLSPVPDVGLADLVEDDGVGGAGGPQPAPALARADLPRPLVELVEQWEGRSPGTRLTPIRLMTFGGGAEAVVRGEAALPPDTDLVSLSVTTTVVGQDRIDVSSALLVAQRSPDPS